MPTAEDFRDLVDLLIDARRRIAQLEKEIARNKIGTISHVDPAKGYRVKLGEDDQGNPKLSPWLPHPEHGGVAKGWFPLSIDQPVMVVSPPGDARKAVLMRAGYAGGNEPPTQAMDEYAFEVGTAKVLMKADRIVVSVGRSSITLMDKDIVYKARRQYFQGKLALGLNYAGTLLKVFPDLVKSVTGAAEKVYVKIITDEVIPDDD